MHVKKGDKVIVLTGKDRGKTGTILRALPKEDRVVVEGVNKIKKHQRSKRRDQKGQIVEREMPVHVSNVKKAS